MSKQGEIIKPTERTAPSQDSYLLSLWQRFIFEITFALGPDPWKYTSPYQQEKYKQTLNLLGGTPITRALEIGCAEGYMTVPLAQRVGSLVAADISQVALNRADAHCTAHKLENVQFVRLDLNKDPLPSGYDLIVCSEVLYYISGHRALQAVAHKLADALKPGGYLLTAHALRVENEPNRTKFDWLVPFGAKFISSTLANTYPLRLVKELRTPFYCIQLFQCNSSRSSGSPACTPEVIELNASTLPLPDSGVLDIFSLAFLYNHIHRWF